MAYQPEAGARDPRYPAFKMPSGHIMPGFGARQALALAGIAAAGIALVALLGIPKAEVAVPVPEAERAAQLDQMRQDRNYLHSLSQEAAIGSATEGGARQVYADPAAREEVEARAAEEGVTAETTDAEIESLVPAERAEEQDAIHVFHRVAALFVVPVALYIGTTFQFTQGTSLRGEFARYRRARMRQKRFAFENPYLGEEDPR